MSVKIGIIVGSTRPSRVGGKVANWVIKSLPKAKDIEYELVDLAEENLPFLRDEAMPAMQQYDQESTKRWAKKVDSFDGYIFVTSEYNAGPPAPLKNAMDTVFNEWTKKPVAFVGYGWMGGVRSIQTLIVEVARMNMVPISSPAIHIIDIGMAFDDQGVPKPEAVRGDFGKVEDALYWWADLLKSARLKD